MFSPPSVLANLKVRSAQTSVTKQLTRKGRQGIIQLLSLSLIPSASHLGGLEHKHLSHCQGGQPSTHTTMTFCSSQLLSVTMAIVC